MQSRDFCFWLQGFFELNEPTTITPEQVKIIRNHLNLVFKHEIDPAMGDAKHQAELNSIHDNKSSALPFDHFHNYNSDLKMRC